MKGINLVAQSFWDEYWGGLRLPVEVRKTPKPSLQNIILETFEKFFPGDTTLSILEIGGAPGQYLAYIAKKFHYDIHALDYSVIGHRKMQENFALLNLKATIYQRDLLENDFQDLPRFDIIYSLGFVEHFLDLGLVVQKHLDLLKPGGILLIGMPNLLGINYWIINKLEPGRLTRHNLASMSIKNWQTFEERFGLEVIFKGYVGGFEPRVFHRGDSKLFLNRLIYSLFVKMRRITDNIGFLRSINSKYWSSYAIGVYRKPAQLL
jgi:SAM-dependent methyltransferase